MSRLKYKRLKVTVCFILFFLLFSACQHERPHIIDPWAISNVDSVSFKSKHHYWKHFYFLLTDTLSLTPFSPNDFGYVTSQPVILQKKEIVVVLNVVYSPSDSVDNVWVMLAKDEQAMGWVREKELLKATVPDNPISRFIQSFSHARISIFLLCFCCSGLLILLQKYRKQKLNIIHFIDIKSIYPTLLCMLVSAAAVLYGYLQQFEPEQWKRFYYEPSLNFFQPISLVLRLFLITIWLIFIVGLASIDELWRQRGWFNFVSYIASLSVVCMLLYLFFTMSVHLYVGYVLLPFYWYFALRQHFLHKAQTYRCGNCHKTISSKGKCPYCLIENI